MDAGGQPSQWALRPAQPGDLEAIVELRATVMRPDLERLGRFDETRVRQRLRDSFDPEHTWAIETDGDFVGCLALRPDEGGPWLEHFYIDPRLQGRGLGSAVLESMLARTDADGLRVRLNVLQGSDARRLYERHGFVEQSQDPIDIWMVREPGGTVSDLVARLRAAGCVYAEEEAAILLEAAGEAAAEDIEALVARRVAGEPLEYVVGWAEFCGLRVGVSDGVFVPRRRTEELVELAVTSAPEAKVVVDLCCGSGALGMAFAARVGVDELHAADVEPRAVACAGENLAAWSRLTGVVPRPARPPGAGPPARPPVVAVHQGDLFEALPGELRGRVDVLLANTPYVPTDEIDFLPGEARDHEPRVTLDGGKDGLAVARRVVDGAGEWLAPGGWVFIEASHRQSTRLREHMESRGLSAVIHDNVVAGRQPGAGHVDGPL